MPCDPEHANRPRHIWDFMLAEVPKDDRELLPNLIAHRSADIDSTRFGQGFQPGRDSYRIPIYGLAVADHVADSDAHPKLDLPLRWGLDHGRPHRLLNGERACNGVRGTLKLNDETVAHSAHEPPPACLDPRVDHVAPNRGEGGVRSLFIR